MYSPATSWSLTKISVSVMVVNLLFLTFGQILPQLKTGVNAENDGVNFAKSTNQGHYFKNGVQKRRF